jgi:hypothetical protein
LVEHVCIQNMYPSGARYPWEFERKGEKIALNPTGPIALDDHELMVQVALSGVALAYVLGEAGTARNPGWAVDKLSGRVVCSRRLYYPSRKNMSAGLRAVVEALRV